MIMYLQSKAISEPILKILMQEDYYYGVYLFLSTQLSSALWALSGLDHASSDDWIF